MKHLLVLAGSHGSGKTTLAEDENFRIGSFINPFAIKSLLNCTDAEAAEIVNNTNANCIIENANFTLETTLSTEDDLKIVQQAKLAGYHIRCIFFITRHPKINIERIKKRVSLGGHNIPDDIVYESHRVSIGNLPNIISLCDILEVYDNSCDASAGEPQLILRAKNGKVSLIPNPTWSIHMLAQLLCANTSQNI